MSSIEEISNSSSKAFSYALGGIGRDQTCHIQLIADESCTSVQELKKWREEEVFNTIKIRLRSYRTVSNAISISKLAKESEWAIIVGADEMFSETLDSFVSDFAVGIGATQFMPGSLECGEGLTKINRLIEIYRENETIQFAGRNFRPS